MVKFVMCCTRKSGTSREEFQDYWKNSHGPFFMKFVEIHKAKKYVQSLTIDTPINQMLIESRSMQPEYDGVAEVYFDSIEAFTEAMSSEEGQKLGAMLQEDENKFIDHSKSTAFFVEENVL